MTSPRPLDGIRVLEIASMIFAPLAAQYLGDMGADVVKLEPPEGDLTRNIGARRSAKMGSFFLTSNRNKRSIVVDLKRPEGQAILARLLEKTDVVLHSMRAGAARRIGLDYASLAAGRPDLIYCHAMGYGESGTYAGRPAYDDIIQAASGLARLQTVVTGEPKFVPTIMADKISGLHAAMGILFALVHRLRTGAGQQVDVGMFETMTFFNMAEHQAGHIFDPPVGPMGYTPVVTAARHPYRTLDGHLALLPYSDAHWRRFFELAGAPEVMADDRFATFAARQKHYREVWAEIERQVSKKSNADWIRLLSAEDIPFSIVNGIEDLPHDPHLRSVDFWTKREHPTEGTLLFPANPLNLRGTPPAITRLPPNLGEQSGEILRECGYDDATVRTFTAAGGVCAPQA